MINKFYQWLHQASSRPEERNEYSGGNWQDKVRRSALEMVGRGPQRVLEIGCGEGLFLAQLGKSSPGIELWGVDNNPQRIKQARQRLMALGLDKVHLSCEDGVSINFPGGFFDTVVCINVLFNLPAIEAVMKVFGEMSRVIKPSGRIVFDIRNSANPLLGIKYFLAPYYDPSVKGLPLRTYSGLEAESILDRAGFRVLKKEHLGFGFRALSPLIVYLGEKR